MGGVMCTRRDHGERTRGRDAALVLRVPPLTRSPTGGYVVNRQPVKGKGKGKGKGLVKGMAKAVPKGKAKAEAVSMR